MLQLFKHFKLNIISFRLVQWYTYMQVKSIQFNHCFTSTEELIHIWVKINKTKI